MIVYESDGGAIVGVIRPTVTMHMIENLDVRRVAKDIERKLKNAIDSLQPLAAAAT